MSTRKVFFYLFICLFVDTRLKTLHLWAQRLLCRQEKCFLIYLFICLLVPGSRPCISGPSGGCVDEKGVVDEVLTAAVPVHSPTQESHDGLNRRKTTLL